MPKYDGSLDEGLEDAETSAMARGEKELILNPVAERRADKGICEREWGKNAEGGPEPPWLALDSSTVSSGSAGRPGGRLTERCRSDFGTSTPDTPPTALAPVSGSDCSLSSAKEDSDEDSDEGRIRAGLVGVESPGGSVGSSPESLELRRRLRAGGPSPAAACTAGKGRFALPRLTSPRLSRPGLALSGGSVPRRADCSRGEEIMARIEASSSGPPSSCSCSASSFIASSAASKSTR
mmetsp:Transcript_31720/g.94273  ORF Transcript_31720/g.94273 Transcript_31720/m.94273 type:complete len:237 (+) Transcript_31720:522-1232(+)